MAQEVQFFKSSRREIELGDYHILKTTGNERRVKADFRIPLSNRITANVPDWILDGYQVVIKDKSFYNKMLCKDVRLEGMTVEFFTTDTVKRKMQTLNGCTLDKFSVERVGKDDKAQTYVNVICYAPCSADIAAWFYSNQGATMFAEFDTTQATFSYDGENEEEDETQTDLPLDVPVSGFDPNDDPSQPIPNDKRSVTKPTDPPAKRSHHKKKT